MLRLTKQNVIFTPFTLIFSFCLMAHFVTGCQPGTVPSTPVTGSGTQTDHATSSSADAGINNKQAPRSQAQPASKNVGLEWIKLFDGKTLTGWKKTNFGGEGDVEVKEGAIYLYFGNDLTGIHTERELPKINYEAELEAMRVDGTDFFCGFTFPVKKDFCSFILGGWGGGTTGLSSLDDMDASENETQSYEELKNKTWYKVRVRVTETHIQVWLNDESLFNQEIKDRKISTRIEVDPSKPFGIASFQTTAALKNIRIRKLKPNEIAAAKKKSQPEDSQ